MENSTDSIDMPEDSGLVDDAVESQGAQGGGEEDLLEGVDVPVKDMTKALELKAEATSLYKAVKIF